MVNVRSFTWFQDSLSWATVMVELGNAFGDLGHNFLPVSTNGMNEDMFKRSGIMTRAILELERLKRTNIPVDLDITFTVPQNLPQRFLPSSKHKACIYAYEYAHFPQHWKRFYNLANFYFPPSDFAAEIFIQNGIPKEKVFVIPHGVDTEKFNTSVEPFKLKTEKSYRFLSVIAPHSRKRIDILLKAYAQTFTSKDDVCLVIKTKLYGQKDQRQPYEVSVGEYIEQLKRKYGDAMPEVEVVTERISNMCSLYNACHTHVTTTGAECWMIPGIESFASGGATGKGMVNIATNYSGQLQFMNSANSLLIDYKFASAKREDQYWHYDQRNKIAIADHNHTCELLLKAYQEYDYLIDKFNPGMKDAAKQFSWTNAANMIMSAIDGKVEHYKPGKVRLPK